MNRYPADQLRRLATEIASAAGVPRADSALLADSLISADLAGTSTHGVSRLGIYLKRIRKGLIDPQAELVIERERVGTLSVDAGNGLGQVQASKVLDRLIPMARTCGIASATPANATDTCAAGTITWDSNFIYVCIAANTWKRAAIAVW